MQKTKAYGMEIGLPTFVRPKPRRKKSLRNRLGRMAVAAACIAGAAALARAAVEKVAWDNAKYVMPRRLEQSIRAQEQELGIRHFGTPRLAFSDSCMKEVLGIYKDSNRGITLCRGFVTVPGYDFLNSAVRVLSFGRYYSAQGVLDHELGHFYTRSLVRVMKGEGMDSGRAIDRPGMQGKIVSEGIAEYFRIRMNGVYNEPDGIGLDDIYRSEYDIVKSVIDMRGKAGISYLVKEFLMENPPESYK